MFHQRLYRLHSPCYHGTWYRARENVSTLPRLHAVASENKVIQEESSLRWGTSLLQGPRESMEDIAQVVEHTRCGFFFATVFDGHAGRAAAEYLEENLFKIFSEQLDSQSLGLACSVEDQDGGLCCPLELHSILTQCYHQADNELLAWLSTKSETEGGSGSTATTVLVSPYRVIVANVGDSRAVLCRDGTSMDLSTEHRVYGRGPAIESETSRVESVGGWVHDGRVCGILAVSRAFGDSDFKGAGLERLLQQGVEDGEWSSEFAGNVRFTGDPVTSQPDVLEMALSKNDEFIIVATDGLWDVLSSQEAVSLVRSDLIRGRTPHDAADKLTNIALKRRTADNVAVVIIDLLGEALWEVKRGEKTSKKIFGLF